MTISCIIIDDEPVAREGIEAYVKKISFLNLKGSYSHPDKIASSILSNVDLIFLDIKLHKLNGLDFYRNLKPEVPFAIVISAFPEHALDGFELNVADYLLKPVSFERFQQAVYRVRKLISLKENSRVEHDEASDYFFIKSNNQIQKLSYEEILYIEGMSNYIVLHTANRKYLSYLKLSIIIEKLAKRRFVRIHKSYVVAIDKIESVKTNEVQIKGQSLPISKTYKDEFMGLVEEKLIK